MVKGHYTWKISIVLNETTSFNMLSNIFKIKITILYLFFSKLNFIFKINVEKKKEKY